MRLHFDGPFGLSWALLALNRIVLDLVAISPPALCRGAWLLRVAAITPFRRLPKLMLVGLDI